MSEESGISRRGFLKTSGVGVLAAVAAAACDISLGGSGSEVTANLMIQHPGKDPQGYPFVEVPYCSTVFGLVLAAGVALRMDPQFPQFALMLDGRENRGGEGWELWIDGEQEDELGLDSELRENSTVFFRYAPHAPKGAVAPVN